MSEGTPAAGATGTGTGEVAGGGGAPAPTWRRRRPGAVLHLVIAAALAVVLCLLSSPRTDGLAATGWTVLVVVPAVLVWLVRALASASDRGASSASPAWRRMAAVPVLLVLATVAWRFDVPLHARFAVSEPALARARDRALARPDGYRYHHGRIGLYRVELISADGGDVSFTIGGDESDDHSYAFACLTPHTVRTRSERPELDGARHLTGCWYLTVESTD